MRCENKRGDPGNGLIRNPDKYSVSDRNWSRSLGFSLRRKKASLGVWGLLALVWGTNLWLKESCGNQEGIEIKEGHPEGLS